MSIGLHIEDYFTARREDFSLPPYRKHDNVFRKQEVGKPFTVYVGMTIKDAFRIKLYRGEDNDSSYYFELYNKVHYNCGYMFDYSTLFLKGDGSGERYAHGSYKYVCLDKKDAIAQAKSYNSAIFNVTFSYDDCKARNGVVCEYLIIELIKKHLTENGREG